MANTEVRNEPTKPEVSKPKRKLGGLYLALFVAGFMLVGQSLEAFLMWKMQARLGLVLLSTAVIIGLGKERPLMALALVILWGGFLVTVMN
jgi:hypothetical protein